MKKRLFRLGALCCVAAMTITTTAQALSVEEAYDILQRSYVDKLPRAAQDAKSLDELFSYTDDYTYYMTAEEYQAFLQGVEGDVSFSGIGAEITYVPEGIRIVSVLKGGGAEKAGLAAGDIIIAIESESCAPGGAEHRAKLLGEAGTSVTVTVRHADGTQADYTVTRALVTQTNTTVSVTGGVGYIDSAVRAWIVDLRGNGGGLTSAAVSALGAFSGEGDLIYFVDQDGESAAQRYSGKDLTDKPAIVLMDSGSASASEIFAGGVLGTGSGIVIGTRSYGKGVAQVLYDESNCPYLHGDAVKVTAYRFYCAGGNTTDRIGVVPTLYIPQDQAVAAARLLSGEIPAGKESSSAALEAILTALTPDAVLYWGENGGERKLTLAQAREKCGFAATSALDFSDVADSEYAQEIDSLAASRIVFGDGGKFRPNATMTRAEVCALLAQALDLYSTADGYFTDVAKGSWYAPSVNAMAAIGLVSGVGGGKFDPSATMTQEEFITVLGRLVEFVNLDARKFLDKNPLAILQPLPKYKSFSHWAIRSAELLTNSVFDENGDAVNMYCMSLEDIEPQVPILREQAAAALYNALRTTGVLKY